EKRLNTHVDQARNRTRRIIRMQCRKNQMSRERRLNGDLCGLKIPRLANHDPVRVLPQEVPQNACKGESDPFVDWYLHNAFEIVFDWLLGGDQLRINRVDLAQTG